MTTGRPRSVVVVAYFAAELLARTLAALENEEHIVLVDNSSDATIRAVAERSGAQYVDPGANIGFAAGVNIALRHLRDEGRHGDVLLLNPDAAITSSVIDTVQSLFEEPGNERLAAVSPRLLGSDGSEQRVRWPFPTPGGMWREALGLRERPGQSEFVIGAVLLLRREALDEIGLFDERYFLYAEETDWQFRAAQRGWRSTVADVRADHVGAGTSSSSRRRLELFHAGQETYIRRWYGDVGWWSYRFAALTGASLRVLFGRQDTRRSAIRRARLYARGPRAIARPPERTFQMRVTHLVVTGNSAGTERYVAEVAAQQFRNGLDVTVIGGDETFMRNSLPASVRWLPGRSVRVAALSMWQAGRQDVVHSHLTAADLLAVATKLVHRAAIVSTRHIAKPRGSGRFNQMVSAVAERFIAQEISISRFVAGSIGRDSTVLHNGVASRDEQCADTNRTVVIAQRLESEKRTQDGIDAWRLSGLSELGWRLLICGEGAERAEIQRRQEISQVVGVEWLGWVTDIHSVMQSATALLATAPAEPLGLTVLEAMSLGLPVIAADGGGHRETVGACPEAMMYDPGDVAGCAVLLQVLVAMDAIARCDYGAALRVRQRSEFDIDAHVERLESIYAQIGARQRVRPSYNVRRK